MSKKLPGDEAQQTLLNVSEYDAVTQLWQGMPDYSHENLKPWQTVLVHFKTPEDRESFAKLVGQQLHSRTKFLWHPKATIVKASDKVWGKGEKLPTRYPVYIISKGRWESRLTSKALEWLEIPYHIVIEPQEYAQYAAVIDPAKILQLPFSNLGLGGIPARNWIWEHAVSTGAARHWILDDNISGFCRFNDNLKVEVDSSATFRAVEDFVDRYDNIVMAAFNYDYFAPRKQGSSIRPLTLNTRCYSGILLSNNISHRWRGRYNEDTDLSLRILKDGLCTVLFNAFLMYKKPTLTMKGGNTDELYKGAEAAGAAWVAHCAECGKCKPCLDGYDSTRMPCDEGHAILSKDGRWLMAESLREQHPDQTTVERKWGRWQHQVDYRRFRNNGLVLKSGIVLPQGSDDYGMTLGKMPEGWGAMEDTADMPEETAAPVSALDFVSQPAQPLAACPSSVAPDLGKALDPEEKPSIQAALAPGAASSPSPAAALYALLTNRGHRLLTRDGRFFITESDKLTDEDRVAIKQHRAELIALSESIPVPSAARAETPSFFVLQPTQSVTTFLGTVPQRDYHPDEPPSLTGINEVVVNFATNGLDWAHGNRPVGVTVSTIDGQLTRFLPFGFAGGNLDEAAVKRWAQRELRGKKITNSKTSFDIHMAREWGVDLEEQNCTFSDIQHTAALLDDHRKRFSIDVLDADYLAGKATKRVDETQHHMHHASDAADREYYTARLVGRLRDVMYSEIEKQELQAVQQLEDDVIPAVVEMEKNGAPIDVALLEEMSIECNTTHDKMLWDIAKEVGFAFDHTPKNWQRLFEHLGLPPTDGNAEALLAGIDHPTVRKAHLASQYASLNSKIFKPYLAKVENGILRFDINQLRGDDGGTVSGRFSIGLIQQVPNADNHTDVFGDRLFPRRLFIAGEGQYLESDAAQIEYRLYAHFANNPQVLAAYKADPTLSFHKMTWEMLKYYKSDMLYAHVKSYNFAVTYGAKSVKLAIMMSFITEAEGEEIRINKRWDDPRLKIIHEIEALYKRIMPEGAVLLARAAHLAKPECDEFCRKNDTLHRIYPHRGYVKTISGRRSRFLTNYKLHSALNRVLQGSGADVMKTKLVELHKARKDTGLLMRMTIHDSVTGDAQTPETLSKVDTILNRQSFPDLKVPIRWESKQGANWADCK